MKCKHLLKLFFLFTFIFLTINAEENYQEIFLAANNFYKENNFEKAYEYYQKIINPSAQINYNLGNCAYKLEKYGYALLYWRRAEKNWGLFNKNELLDNINLLKKNLSSDKSENSLVQIKNYFVSFIKSTPTIILQISFLAIWLFLFIYLRYLYKRKRKYLIILLFFLIAALGILLISKYISENKRYGVIINSNAILYSGPGNNFQNLGNLPEASEVIIQKNSGDFYKIKYNKLFGWINRKDVEQV